MTEKRLRYMRAFLVGSSEFVIDDNENHEKLKRYDILDRLNEQNETINQLKKENHFLKKKIERNKGYIDRIPDKSEWKITSYTFKQHPPCHIYSCAKCPYRRGYRCCYERLKK